MKSRYMGSLNESPFFNGTVVSPIGTSPNDALALNQYCILFNLYLFLFSSF